MFSVEKYFHQKLSMSPTLLCFSDVSYHRARTESVARSSSPKANKLCLAPTNAFLSLGFYHSCLFLWRNSSMLLSQNAKPNFWERKRAHSASSPLTVSPAISWNWRVKHLFFTSILTRELRPSHSWLQGMKHQRMVLSKLHSCQGPN